MPRRSEELIRDASRGDQVALDELLADNLPRLRSYVRMKAGPALRARESCSDLVQSVCREVLVDLPKFEFRGTAEFRHWLMKQALHKIVDRARHYRVGARDAADGLAEPDGDGALHYATWLTPSRDAVGREQLRRLEREFEALPADYREAIFLYRVTGLRHKQIAAEMGRSEGAVRNLLYRGLARLSLRLAEADGAERVS